MEKNNISIGIEIGRLNFKSEERKVLKEKINAYIKTFIGSVVIIYDKEKIEECHEFFKEIESYIQGSERSDRLSKLLADTTDSDLELELMELAKCSKNMCGSFFTKNFKMNLSRNNWWVKKIIDIDFEIGDVSVEKGLIERDEEHGCKFKISLCFFKEIL